MVFEQKKWKRKNNDGTRVSPAFIENSIKNFHFVFRNTSLRLWRLDKWKGENKKGKYFLIMLDPFNVQGEPFWIYSTLHLQGQMVIGQRKLKKKKKKLSSEWNNTQNCSSWHTFRVRLSSILLNFGQIVDNEFQLSCWILNQRDFPFFPEESILLHFRQNYVTALMQFCTGTGSQW